MPVGNKKLSCYKDSWALRPTLHL